MPVSHDPDNQSRVARHLWGVDLSPSLPRRLNRCRSVRYARATDRGFVVDAQASTIIGEICKELDCIPLAIELAASRVSALGLEPLRKRLKGGMTLTGNRDAPHRHQTMEATIAWTMTS